MSNPENGGVVQLTVDELTMLNNCLNELCNGVHIEDWEFQTRIGWDRDTVRALLNKINASLPGEQAGLR